MISRRSVLKGLGAVVAAGAGLSSYAFAIEPAWRLRVARYALTPGNWPRNLQLTIAVIADLHACEPWVGRDRIRKIVDQTNALNADIIMLLGDYVAGHRWVTNWVHSDIWSAELGRLRAPLGVHAVLGNHDWWEDKTAQRDGRGPTFTHRALRSASILVYENDAVQINKDGQSFWLAGLGDQLALLPSKIRGRKKITGVDDLKGTLAKITNDAPVILMAHEPDIFPQVPERVSLTLSGHTHGGQVRIFGFSPVVPSRYGNRFAYGHIIESSGGELDSNPRNLIVSGGLGCSIMPVRFGVPPEIVVVELGAQATS